MGFLVTVDETVHGFSVGERVWNKDLCLMVGGGKVTV